MKERFGLPTLAYVLVGLLALSALALSLGRRSGNAEPSTGSYGPSGLKVFADLLRQEGYDVVATRRPEPVLDPKRDVAIAIKTSSNPMFPVDEHDVSEQLHAFAEDGGRIVETSMSADFRLATRAARQLALASTYRKSSEIVSELRGMYAPTWVTTEPDTTELWTVDGTQWASLAPVSEGEGLYIADFAGATNRFIDRGNNAAVFVDLIRAIAPPGSRLVFLEAAWGNASDPGLFESIGDWAAAGWSQILILCLVIGYSLGKPFGIPEQRRARQVGQRELVDAYGSTLYRAKATDVALQGVLADADRRLRKALKMDSGLDEASRNLLLPPELVRTLERVKMAIATRVPSDIAVGLANELDYAVSQFAGDRRKSMRKRRKS